MKNNLKPNTYKSGNEILLRKVIDTVADGLAVIDKNGRIILWNNAAEKITGLSFHTVGKGHFRKTGEKLFFVENSPELINIYRFLAAAADSGATKKEENFLEAVILHKSEGKKDIQLYPAAIETEDEKYLAINFRDITRQKKIEERKDYLLQRLNDIIELIPDAAFTLDSGGKVFSWNKAMEELTGVNKNKVLGKGNFIHSKALYGKRNPILIDMIDDDISLIKKKYRSAYRKKGKLYAEKIETGLADGRITYLWAVAAPLFDRNKVRFGSIEVIRDVTSIRNREEELKRYKNHLEELVNERTSELKKVNLLLEDKVIKLKRAEEEALNALGKEKELSNLKSRFISITSHEFRTPLATINSSTELIEMLAGSDGEKEIRNQAERIKSNVNTLTEIMDDILINSRVDSGIIKFNPKPADFESFALEISKKAESILTKKHSLNKKIAKDIPVIAFDKTLLKTILMNVLSNAVKYSPEGGNITFETSLKDRFLQIIVSDEGIGIPPENLHQLYEPFSRADNVGNIRGTGLGMSIVKRFIEIQNGEISVSSKLNEGTVFRILIPVVKT